MSTKHSVAFVGSFVVISVVACGSAPDDTSSTAEAVCSEAYNWSDFPATGQCVGGAEGFYTKHFGMAGSYVPGLAAYASQGACKTPGACLIWVDNLPNSSVWERVSGTPQLFDMAVYPPTSGNPYGHVAVVDHVTSGVVYVMDDNYVAPNEKASCPHTVSWAPYGYYRLRPNCAKRSGLNCGGDGVFDGVLDTLYDCKLGQPVPLTATVCEYGCQTEPDGVADECRPRLGY